MEFLTLVGLTQSDSQDSLPVAIWFDWKLAKFTEKLKLLKCGASENNVNP